MDKDIIWFAENMCGLNLTENHKEILLAFQEAKDRGQKIFINYGRIQGKGLLREIFYSFENWLKDQKIATLEKALELACNRIKSIYCSDYCCRLCDDWAMSEEDIKNECKIYYKCWNKECILEQAQKELKNG